MSATHTTAVEAALARSIRIEAMLPPDEFGNCWQAVIARRGRGVQQPLACMLAPTAEQAARDALQYVGARGWAA